MFSLFCVELSHIITHNAQKRRSVVNNSAFQMLYYQNDLIKMLHRDSLSSEKKFFCLIITLRMA